MRILIEEHQYQAEQIRDVLHVHFDNTPLSEVLEELSKLSGTSYTASDESKRLTGVFITIGV